jgi:hypothetical protein
MTCINVDGKKEIEFDVVTVQKHPRLRAHPPVPFSRIKTAVLKIVQRFLENRERGGRKTVSAWRAIDESHLPKSKRKGTDRALDKNLSDVQRREVIRHEELRLAVYRRPERRTDVLYADGPCKGKPMRAVAPRRATAHIVKGRPTRSIIVHEPMSPWMHAASSVLGRVRDEEGGKARYTSLTRSVELDGELAELRREMERCESERARLSPTERNQSARDRITAELRELAIRIQADSQELRSIVHGPSYREGIKRTWHYATLRADTMAELFGE